MLSEDVGLEQRSILGKYRTAVTNKNLVWLRMMRTKHLCFNDEHMIRDSFVAPRIKHFGVNF